MTHAYSVVHAADALTAWFSGVSTDVGILSKNVVSLYELSFARNAKVDKIAFRKMDYFSREFIINNLYAVGAGTFFTPRSVEKGNQTFEWWSRKESGAIERLEFDLTPGSSRFYDYEHLPFFSTAAATGEHTLWGPYIDYLGFEEYILTFTAPLSIQGNFAGVAGCDIRIRDLEPIIMPILQLIPNDAALINASNRVILGNSGLYLVGERVRLGRQDQRQLALGIPQFGLSIIYRI